MKEKIIYNVKLIKLKNKNTGKEWKGENLDLIKFDELGFIVLETIVNNPKLF